MQFSTVLVATLLLTSGHAFTAKRRPVHADGVARSYARSPSREKVALRGYSKRGPKSIVNKAKPPANKAKTPVNKPKPPVNKPKTPVNKPKTPVNKPKTPVNKGKLTKSSAPRMLFLTGTCSGNNQYTNGECTLLGHSESMACNAPCVSSCTYHVPSKKLTCF